MIRALLARLGSWRVLPAVVLSLASVALVAVQAPQHSALSLYDEYVYYDYLVKVPTQGLVVTGERTGPEARSAILCRGVVNITDPKSNCESYDITDDKYFPYGGRTGADIYTPLYFAVTWVAAQPFTWFGIGLLDAGRLVGMLWLAGGVLVLYALLRRLGVGRLLATGLGLGVVATPSAYWATTYLSTDAPAILVSAGAFLLGVAVMRRERSPWWLLPFTVIAVALKVQFIFPVLAVGLAIIVMRILAWRRDRDPGLVRSLLGDRAVVAVVVSVVAGVVAQAVWLVVRTLLAKPSVDGGYLEAEKLNPVSLVQNVFLFVSNVGLDQTNVGAIGTFFGYLLTMATATFLVVMITRLVKGSDEETSLAWGLGVIGLLMGPALLFLVWMSSRTIIELPLRYGIVLLPGFVAGVGMLVSRLRWAGPATAVLGVAAVLTSIAS